MLIGQGLYSLPKDHWAVTAHDEVDRGERLPFGGFEEARYLQERPDVGRAVKHGASTRADLLPADQIAAAGFGYYLYRPGLIS